MPNYKDGKIYTIRSFQTDKIYIGSTTQPLFKRLYEHRDKYEKWKKGMKFYTSSYNILAYDDHYIELLKYAPCDTKLELCRIEGEEIRNNLSIAVNIKIAGRNQNEWENDNKEKIKENDKKYYIENKERIAQYYKDNIDTIKSRKKENYEKNKEKLIAKVKEHYKENKNEINDKRKIKVECLCGCLIRKGGMKDHLESKKHNKLLSNQLKISNSL